MIPIVVLSLFLFSLVAIIVLTKLYYHRTESFQNQNFHAGTPVTVEYSGDAAKKPTPPQQEMPYVPPLPPVPPPPPLPTLPGVAGMNCQATEASSSRGGPAASSPPSSTGATYTSSVTSEKTEGDSKESGGSGSLLEEIVSRFNQPASTMTMETNVNSNSNNKIGDILFNMHFSNVQVTDITNNNNTKINIGQLNNLKQEISSEMVLLKPNSRRGRTLKNIMSTVERLESAIAASPGSDLDKMYRGVGYGVEDLERCAELNDTIYHDIRQNTYTKDEVDTIRQQLKQEILDEIAAGGGAGSGSSMGAMSTKMHENQVVQEKINKKADSCVVQPLLSKGSAINVLDYTQVGSIMPKFVYYETQ